MGDDLTENAADMTVFIPALAGDEFWAWDFVDKSWRRALSHTLRNWEFNDPDREDIFAESVLKFRAALRNDKVDAKKSPLGYFLAIGCHVAADMWNERHPPSPNPPRGIAAQMQRSPISDVKSALASLSERDRWIVIESMVQKRRGIDLAADLDLTESAFYTAKHRAKQRFSAALAQLGHSLELSDAERATESNTDGDEPQEMCRQ